jgi:hypothetical protein
MEVEYERLLIEGKQDQSLFVSLLRAHFLPAITQVRGERMVNKTDDYLREVLTERKGRLKHVWNLRTFAAAFGQSYQSRLQAFPFAQSAERFECTLRSAEQGWLAGFFTDFFTPFLYRYRYLHFSL